MSDSEDLSDSEEMMDGAPDEAPPPEPPAGELPAEPPAGELPAEPPAGEPPAGEPPADDFPRGEPPPAEADPAERIAALEAELEAARAESAEHKDRWLRAAAELENVRRRAARELEDGRERARADVLRDVLVVLDDLDRALAAAAADSESPGAAGDGSGGKTVPPAESPIVTGLRLIRARTAELLRRHGVTEIEAEGQAFDPHVHDGIMTLPAGDLPDGTVARVFERGYWLGERVLRPAKVAVARAEST